MFDKQRFMFKERLTQLERNPPEKTQVSQQRERMARGFADVLRFKSDSSTSAVEKDSEELDEKKMAA